MVVHAAEVLEKVRRASVGCEQNIRRAVVIEVRGGRAARHKLFRKPELLAYLLKLAFTEVVEHQRQLGVGDLGLNLVDIGLDVAVGDEEVRAAVEVVIEEEKSK